MPPPPQKQPPPNAHPMCVPLVDRRNVPDVVVKREGVRAVPDDLLPETRVRTEPPPPTALAARKRGEVVGVVEYREQQQQGRQQWRTLYKEIFACEEDALARCEHYLRTIDWRQFLAWRRLVALTRSSAAAAVVVAAGGEEGAA